MLPAGDFLSWRGWLGWRWWCNRSVIDNGCTTCLSLARGTRRASPMWRPPGAILTCYHTPGCGALQAPHPGLCMVRPFGPNLADLHFIAAKRQKR